MNRQDFIFTIGFQGNAAIVDKRLRRKYGGASTKELFEAGLHKAAFCAALTSDSDSDMKEFVSLFSSRLSESSGSAGQGGAAQHDGSAAVEVTVETLKRLFGVHGVPEGISKIIYV